MVYQTDEGAVSCELTDFGQTKSCSSNSFSGAGQYYFNARWYDPTLGRFLSEDPARSGDNWFAYCENDPLSRVDLTGLDDHTNRSSPDVYQPWTSDWWNGGNWRGPTTQATTTGTMRVGESNSTLTKVAATALDLTVGSAVTAVTGKQIEAANDQLTLQQAFPGDIQRAQIGLFGDIALAATGGVAAKVGEEIATRALAEDAGAFLGSGKQYSTAFRAELSPGTFPGKSRGVHFQDHRALQNFLLEHPEAAPVIQGTGGVRKLRWAREGRGKSGGLRTIYIDMRSSAQIYLVTVFGKDEKADLSPEDKKAIKSFVKRL